MAYNGSGTFNRIHNWVTDKGNSVAVTASRMDAEMDGFATGLSTALTKDGQTTATARINFASGVSAAAGSISAAAYAAASDTNTGVYFPATDQVGFTAGGVGILQTSSTVVSITATTTASSTATGALIVSGGVGISGDIFHGGRIRGKGAVPIGSVLPFCGTSVPLGWLESYGQNVSRTDYALLFNIISTIYGAGDGSTTFGLPDLRGRVIASEDDMGTVSANRLTGADDGVDGDTLGAAGGGETQSLATANLPAYTPAGSVSITDTRTWSFANRNYAIPAGAGANNQVQDSTGIPNFSTAVSPDSGTITGSFTGNAQGGTSTAFGIVQPTIVLKGIIYVGV